MEKIFHLLTLSHFHSQPLSVHSSFSSVFFSSFLIPSNLLTPPLLPISCLLFTPDLFITCSLMGKWRLKGIDGKRQIEVLTHFSFMLQRRNSLILDLISLLHFFLRPCCSLSFRLAFGSSVCECVFVASKAAH